MEATLRQQVEYYLGTVIEPPEWEKARNSAERKLKRIIEREGDGNGARRETWYLAQFIAENVKESRFPLFAHKEIQIYDNEQKGVKKEQLVS